MEEFRLQYALSRDSVVIDAGAFRGDYIDWCRKKWDCTVYAFEPVESFFWRLLERFKSDVPHLSGGAAQARVRIFLFGLGARTETRSMVIQGDATSVYLDRTQESTVETVTLRDVVDVWTELGLTNVVDLMKINIEGGEYELLPRMLDTGLAGRVRYFQVQYHGIGAGPEGPDAARDRIRSRLYDSHREEWCVNGGQWESWSLR